MTPEERIAAALETIATAAAGENARREKRERKKEEAEAKYLAEQEQARKDMLAAHEASVEHYRTTVALRQQQTEEWHRQQVAAWAARGWFERFTDWLLRVEAP